MGFNSGFKGLIIKLAAVKEYVIAWLQKYCLFAYPSHGTNRAAGVTVNNIKRLGNL